MDIITQTAVVDLDFDPDKKLVSDDVMNVQFRDGDWLASAARNDNEELGKDSIISVKYMIKRVPPACVPDGYLDDPNMRIEVFHNGVAYRHTAFEAFQLDVLQQKPGSIMWRECPNYIKHIQHKLLRQLEFHNCYRMSYDDDPAAFLACKACMITIAHRYDDLENETSKIDMKMAYGAEYGPAFAKMNLSNFFHGYVRNACMPWMQAAAFESFMKLEYAQSDPRCLRTTSEPFKYSLIGNSFPCDVPFTWYSCTESQLGRYGFFAMYELDLCNVEEPLRSNLLQLKVFEEHYIYPESCHDLFLPSPILHFLEYHGAKWRALGVCLTRTAGYSMFPYRDDEPSSSPNMTPAEIEKLFRETRAYPIIHGMARAEFHFEIDETYCVPDAETANVLRDCAANGLLRSRKVYVGKAEIGAPLVDKFTVIKGSNGKTVMLDAQPQVSHTSYGGYNDANGSKVVVHKFKEFINAHPWVVCELSYSFVTIMAALAIVPEGSITSLRVDEIGTNMTADELNKFMADLIHHDVPGTFKPAQESDDSDRCNGSMSKEFVNNIKGVANVRGDKLYTKYMQEFPFRSGVKPPAKMLWWSPAQNQICNVTYVTGPAGSGKTTGLFSNANWAILRGQGVWNEKTIFATLMNNLANAVTNNKAMPGAKGRTIYNFCNRTLLASDNVLSSPTQRSHRFTDNLAYNKKQTNLLRGGRLQSRSIARYSAIVIDEANLNARGEFMDAIDVAAAHHFHIFIICDYDDEIDKFKQLYAVNYHINLSSPSYMREIIANALGGAPTVGRLNMREVFRQRDDQLKRLIQHMRGMSGDARGQLTLFNSLCANRDVTMHNDTGYPNFLRVRFDSEFMPKIRPNHTKIVSPRHKILQNMGRLWFHSMTADFTDETMIEVMWSNCGQTMKTPNGKYSRFLSWFDTEQDYVCKYDTAMVSWKELMHPEVRSLWPSFPYEKDSAVNLSMFRTPFALQGTELAPEDNMIMLWEGNDVNNGWSDEEQPNAVYVVLSRVIHHTQITMVDL